MNEQSNCNARKPKQTNFFTRCYQGKQTIVSQVESRGVPLLGTHASRLSLCPIKLAPFAD